MSERFRPIPDSSIRDFLIRKRTQRAADQGRDATRNRAIDRITSFATNYPHLIGIMLESVPGRPIGVGLGDTLRSYRNEAHLTLSDLADASGISKGTLSRVETGTTRAIKEDTLNAILKGFGWEDDDPRVQALRDLWQVQGEKSKRNRRG